MSTITIRIERPTIEDLRTLVSLTDQYVLDPTIGTHLNAISVTGELFDDTPAEESLWLGPMPDSLSRLIRDAFTVEAEPTPAPEDDLELGDELVNLVGDSDIAAVLAATGDDTPPAPNVDDPTDTHDEPTEPAETNTAVRPIAAPDPTRKTSGYTDAELIDLVAGNVDLDMPINRQLITLVGCPTGSVHPIKRRCIDLGLLPPTTIRTVES